MKKMNKKNVIITSVVVIVILAVLGGLYYRFGDSLSVVSSSNRVIGYNCKTLSGGRISYINEFSGNTLIINSSSSCSGLILNKDYCSGGKAYETLYVCQSGTECVTINGIAGISAYCKVTARTCSNTCYVKYSTTTTYPYPYTTLPYPSGCTYDSQCSQVNCFVAPCPVNRCVNGICQLTQVPMYQVTTTIPYMN